MFLSAMKRQTFSYLRKNTGGKKMPAGRPKTYNMRIAKVVKSEVEAIDKGLVRMWNTTLKNTDINDVMKEMTIKSEQAPESA